MNTAITRFTLIAATVATLSACAPMPPQDHTPYTPPVTGNPYPPVTNPNPATPPPIANPDPVPQQRYVVQLIATANQSKAKNIRNTFVDRGYNTFISPLMVNGQQLHRVQIGYYTNKEEADATLNQLRRQNPGDIYVADAIVKTP